MHFSDLSAFSPRQLPLSPILADEGASPHVTPVYDTSRSLGRSLEGEQSRSFMFDRSVANFSFPRSEAACTKEPTMQSSIQRLLSETLLALTKNEYHERFGKLWATYAPTGNLYRYNGLVQERLRHGEDLNAQMLELVKTLKEKGQCANEIETPKDLKVCLQHAVVRNASDEEMHEWSLGYRPLEAFLDIGSSRSGMLLYPRDPEERMRWVENVSMTLIVCAVQIVVPLLILVSSWHTYTSNVQNPWAFLEGMSIQDAISVGHDTTERLQTVTGLLFLLLIIWLLLRYAKQEAVNVEKAAFIPLVGVWETLGSFTKVWCTLFLCLALPLLFCNAGGPMEIIWISMGAWFVFTLDDLSGPACSYLGHHKNDYQQEAAWNFALLAYCPVNIADLVKLNAASRNELWQIKFSKTGKLQQAQQSQTKHIVNQTNMECLTRISFVQAESTPLVPAQGFSSIVYHTSGTDDHAIELPSALYYVIRSAWMSLSYALSIALFVVPLAWLASSKYNKQH